MNIDNLLYLTSFFYWTGFLPIFPYWYFLDLLNKIILSIILKRRVKKIKYDEVSGLKKKNPCA